MWAAGVYDLRLGSADIWRLTPRQIAALWSRHLAAEERQDRRIGALMALYAEAHRDHDKRSEPFTVDDFVGNSRFQVVVRTMEARPGETTEELLARISRPTMNPEQQIESIKANARGFGRWTVENA